MAKHTLIGSLFASAAFVAAASTPAMAVDALGIAGAVGNIVGAATGAPVPLVDDRLGGLPGHAGKGGGGKAGGGGGKRSSAGGGHHHK